MFLTVTAEQLRPEDYCRGSRTRVLAHPRPVPEDGSKVELKVQRHNGKMAWVRWNRRTKIGIERSQP